MSEYTKGEWEIVEVQKHKEIILKELSGYGKILGIDSTTHKDKMSLDKEVICIVFANPSEIANARLIAAAPDLLEACEMAREWLGSDMVATKESIEQIEAAIAKATRKA